LKDTFSYTFHSSPLENIKGYFSYTFHSSPLENIKDYFSYTFHSSPLENLKNNFSFWSCFVADWDYRYNSCYNSNFSIGW
jgi:hypothetical protein